MAHLSKVKHSSADWRKVKSDAIAVGIYDDLKLSRQLQGVNRELGRGLSNALVAKLIKGKVGEVKTVVGKKGAIAFVFGLGKRGELNAEKLRRAGGGVSKVCIANKVDSVAFIMPVDGKENLPPPEPVVTVVTEPEILACLVHAPPPAPPLSAIIPLVPALVEEAKYQWSLTVTPFTKPLVNAVPPLATGVAPVNIFATSILLSAIFYSFGLASFTALIFLNHSPVLSPLSANISLYSKSN